MISITELDLATILATRRGKQLFYCVRIGTEPYSHFPLRSHHCRDCRNLISSHPFRWIPACHIGWTTPKCLLRMFQPSSALDSLRVNDPICYDNLYTSPSDFFCLHVSYSFHFVVDNFGMAVRKISSLILLNLPTSMRQYDLIKRTQILTL